jgi:small-conductance mechanosensitive channel
MKEILSDLLSIFHSDHPFMLAINYVLSVLSYIWEYKIFETSDHQSIAVANMVVGLFLLIFVLKFAKFLSLKISARLQKINKVDPSVINSLERISYYAFVVIFTIFVLDIVNVPLTAFTVVGTTLALGIGLGSQNIANNFISGLIIMIERPIKLGDIIEIKNLNVVGKVINIGARCVSVRSENNINILIPNSNILQDSVINWTFNDTHLKIVMPQYFDNNTEMEKIDKIFYQVINDNVNILKDPPAKVLVKSMGKDGLNIEVEFWINLSSNVDSKYIINDINRATQPLFEKHGVKLADKPKESNGK